MAITYGFYNSMNGDRKYDAVQLSSIFDGVIRDGVFQSIGGYLATKPGTGMQVIVAPGKAWFDHTWTVNDADLPLEIAQSDLTLSRYDAVILETDATKSVRENSIKVLKGTPSSNPQKPTLTNEGDVHQHPLAYILVPGGSSSIQAQNIDIMVGKTECPFVTSILESVSIEALLEKWEGEFRVWFDDLQDQMSGDVATNLQNQINKINQTTATEETKSLYGIPSDGTPDDVFQAINSIGDIKVSIRTDLGDSWLLCNGETVSPSAYPELSSHLSEAPAVWEKYLKLSNSDWNLAGKYLFYSRAPGVYQYIDLETKTISEEKGFGTSHATYFGDAIEKVGDYYVVFPNSSQPFFLYSKDVVTGWSESPDLTPGYAYETFCGAFDGSRYVFILTGESVHKLLYSSSLESAEWQQKDAPVGSRPITWFGYVNGFWYIISSQSSYRYISYTTDITSDEWDEIRVSAEVLNPSALGFDRTVSGINYYDGKYYVHEPSTYGGEYSFSTSISGFSDPEKIEGPEVIYCADGVCVGIYESYKSICADRELSASLGSKRTSLDITSFYTALGYSNGYFYIKAMPSGDTSYWLYRQKATDILWPKLPTINIGDAYAYIRGK